MKFSNRNAFPLAMRLTGLLVLSALTASAASEAEQLSGLREQAAEVRAKQLNEASAKTAAARELWAKQSEKDDPAARYVEKMKFYADAETLFVEAIAALTPAAGVDMGTLAKDERESAERDLRLMRAEWAQTIIARAKQMIQEQRYQDAMRIVTEASLIDRNQTEIVNDIVDFCRRKQQGLEFRQATDINEFEANYQSNLEEIEVLMRRAQTYYDNDRFDDARIQLERVYLLDPFQTEAIRLLDKTYDKLYTAAKARKAADIREMVHHNAWGWIEPIFPSELESDNTLRQEERVGDSDSIYAKLERIVFPTVEFDEADVLSVIRYLNTRSKIYDPEKEGVNITAGFDKAVSDQLNKVTMSFSRIPMGEVLRYLCQDVGLKYKVDDGSIFIGTTVDEMQTRTFQVRGDLLSGITGTSGISTDGGMNDPMGGDPGLGGFGGGAEFGGGGFGGGGGGGGGGGEGGGTGEGTRISEAYFTSDEGSGSFRGTGSTRQAAITSAILKSHFQARGVRFDSGSSIAYDRRGNKLIVRNTVENLRRMDELLRQLDAIETPLVMIELKLVEISEEDWQELGFHWSLSLQDNNNPTANSGVANSGWYVNQVGNMLSSGGTEENPIHLLNNFKIFPNFGDFGDFNVNLGLTVDAVSRNRRAEVLSSPKVVANSGTSASIELFRTYFFPDEYEAPELTVSGDTVQIKYPTIEFADEGEKVGIILNARPQVDPDNYTITLELHPIIRDYVDQTVYKAYVNAYETMYRWDTTSQQYVPYVVTLAEGEWDIWMPVFSVREAELNVKVYDGETIVIGGMIQNETTSFHDRWPGLGDLPFVGRFFSSQQEITTKSNLLIFVTTRLVNNDGRPIRRNMQRDLPDFYR